MGEEYLTRTEIKKELEPLKKKLGLRYYEIKSMIEKREEEKKNRFVLRKSLDDNY
jgi:hypothetical protein